MRDKIFLDSNILLYAFMKDPVKQGKARNLIDECLGVISNQVIAEVSTNLIKKCAYTSREISELTVKLYSNFEVISIGLAEFIKSAEIRERHSISFWDSLIVASAIESGCDKLYTEDMQNGLKIDHMIITNPFNLAR